MAIQPRPDETGAHWVRNPVTTRHSQTALLLVTIAWGMSYCMPLPLRIPFSEVYPPNLSSLSQVPLWGYGAAMLFSALLALAGERMILISLLRKDATGRIGWRMSIFAHMCLCALYATLACAALLVGLHEAHWMAAGLISAASRPILWGYISYLHWTYARLPIPSPDYQEPKKKKGRLRFLVREQPDDHSE